MAEDDSVGRLRFNRIRAVEWDPRKAASNRRKHGIDFDEAIEVFYGPNLVRRSDRNKEERWLAIGEIGRPRDRRRFHLARRYASDHLGSARANK